MQILTLAVFLLQLLALATQAPWSAPLSWQGICALHLFLLILLFPMIYFYLMLLGKMLRHNLCKNFLIRGSRLAKHGKIWHHLREQHSKIGGTTHCFNSPKNPMLDGASKVAPCFNKKKVTFLWTLSVPPLAPPGLRTLRGVFFLKARTSDSRRLERKNA